jgi:hypothetical protein
MSVKENSVQRDTETLKTAESPVLKAFRRFIFSFLSDFVILFHPAALSIFL